MGKRASTRLANTHEKRRAALHARNIALQRQLIVPVFYRGSEVGAHRLDLVVDERMVVELKAIKTIENIHFAVVRSS